MVSDLLKSKKKFVIKIGSNTLSDGLGRLDESRIANICGQILRLLELGKDVVVVSSGAKMTGARCIENKMHLNDISYKQALCAIGQIKLMNLYSKYFERDSLQIGQLLLTREDFCEQRRMLNIRNTLFTLIDEGVIPIVNENDTVGISELEIGDNDTLGAQVATLWSADIMIILSDIDGIYDFNPHKNRNANLIERIRNIKESKKNIKFDYAGKFGSGGITTKFVAAEILGKCGIPMIIANGRVDNIIDKLIKGQNKATLFMEEK